MDEFSEDSRIALGKLQRESDLTAFEAHIATLMEKNPGNDVFYNSILEARRIMGDENLTPELDKNLVPTYSLRQGVTAAVRAREDAATITIIQATLLTSLAKIRQNQIDTFEVITAQLKISLSLRRLAWGAILLLSYIAIRLS